MVSSGKRLRELIEAPDILSYQGHGTGSQHYSLSKLVSKGSM